MRSAPIGEIRTNEDERAGRVDRLLAEIRADREAATATTDDTRSKASVPGQRQVHVLLPLVILSDCHRYAREVLLSERGPVCLLTATAAAMRPRSLKVVKVR